MNCRTASASLSALIDRELSEETEEAVLQHLSHCESCRMEERELRSLKRMLTNCGGCDIDPIFESRIRGWIANPESAERCPSPVQDARPLWPWAPLTLLTLWLVTQTVLPSSAEAEAPANPAKAIGNSSASANLSPLLSNGSGNSAFELTATDYGR